MRGIRITISTVFVASLSLVCLGSTPASAMEVNNFIEPPFGAFQSIGGVAVSQGNGNVYAGEERGKGEVKVFGREGGEPAEGAPPAITAKGSFRESLSPTAIAVDSSGSEAYVVGYTGILDRYRLNGSNQYEYVCALIYYGGGGNRCQAQGGERGPEEMSERTDTFIGGSGVALDPAGNLYVGGHIGTQFVGAEEKATVFEFNPAGEAVGKLSLPRTPETGNGSVNLNDVAVAADGTIYVVFEAEETQLDHVVELKRSSLTGPVEGEPVTVPNTTGARRIALDRADGELIVDFANSGKVLNGVHQVVSRFGAGIISEGGALAIDEATGEIYLANPAEHDVDRFAAAVPAAVPAVDAPPPAVTDATRTSALLSGTVATGDATTRWHIEYVAADEYDPASADPYVEGGGTAASKLPPAAGGTNIGPVPLTGLLPSTTYDYRLVASNELGTTYGPDHTFTTAAATLPLVTTGVASEVTQTGVLLSGAVTTEELQTSYEFEVGLDTSYGGAKLFGNAGSNGIEAVSASLQFLIPGTTYHYRLVATNEDGTTDGQDMTFTTPGVPAIIAQPAALPAVTSPTVAFPNVSGAITKAQGTGKRAKARKRKAGKPVKHKQKAGKHSSHKLGGGKRK